MALQSRPHSQHSSGRRPMTAPVKRCQQDVIIPPWMVPEYAESDARAELDEVLEEAQPLDQSLDQSPHHPQGSVEGIVPLQLRPAVGSRIIVHGSVAGIVPIPLQQFDLE